MKIEVITPEKVAKTTEGVEVIIPTTNGVIGVRRGHLPLVAPLKIGEVVIKHQNGELEHLAVARGFVEVLPESVNILTDSADLANELDQEKIEKAILEAKKAKEEAKDKSQFAAATSLIELNLARLKVSKRKKAYGSHPAPTENQS
jgi:F-type H+-transporting ATPase subunit epsilon